jgi:hypothetical protein
MLLQLTTGYPITPLQADRPGATTNSCYNSGIIEILYSKMLLVQRRKSALVAVARSILVSAWHMPTNRQPYRDLGGGYFDQRKKETKVSNLTRQLEKLTGEAIHIELQTFDA